MTLLAHDLVMLRIQFDSTRLYDGEDIHYALWLSLVRDRVAATRRAIHKKAEQDAKTK